MGAKFATDVVDTGINNTSKNGGKICHRSLIPVANLPPASLIPAEILPPVSLIPVGAPLLAYISAPVANLPPVSLIPVGAPLLAYISANFRKNSKWS